jgi:hypothetical protein
MTKIDQTPRVLMDSLSGFSTSDLKRGASWMDQLTLLAEATAMALAIPFAEAA